MGVLPGRLAQYKGLWSHYCEGLKEGRLKPPFLFFTLDPALNLINLWCTSPMRPLETVFVLLGKSCNCKIFKPEIGIRSKMTE